MNYPDLYLNYHVIITWTHINLYSAQTHRSLSAAAGFAEGFGPHHGSHSGDGGGDGGEVAAVAAALKEKVESAARLPDIQGPNSIEKLNSKFTKN